MVATAIIGSAIVGGVSSIVGAKSAASAQTQAASDASKTQLQMYEEAKGELQPFVNAGTAEINPLLAAIPGLAAPISMDEASLEQTPGYQFNLAQGNKAVNNAMSANGLGASGAALKGIDRFNVGLADSTYQNQFNNALLNKQMALTAYTAPLTIGENAAATSGTNAINTGSGIASNTIGAGNANAASDIAGANAVGNTTNSLAMALYGKQLGLF